jgi:5-methylcytosine-specific restriction endonuclease McrA
MAKKKGLGSNRRMEILGTFSPEDVLPYITKEKTRRKYVGDDGRVWQVRMSSGRYFTFAESLSCVVCGITGNTMLLERTARSREQPHFNLYAVSGNCRILMTKDHIQPKSRGGGDSCTNFQTMCIICNNLKSHHRITVAQAKRLRATYNALRPITSEKHARHTIDAMAERMATDDGAKPMTAGELASILMKTPDAIVAIKDKVGRDRVRKVVEANMQLVDSEALPPVFLVIE